MGQSEYWSEFMRKKLGRRTILKGGALAGAGLLTGSAIGCQNAPPTAATPAASPTSAAAASPAPAARKPQGSITALGGSSIYGSPTGEYGDPHRMHHAVTVWKLWTDDLVMPDDTGPTDKGLATSWSVAPDGLSWTFKLRKGVLFHDETEMTAEDVKFSWERQLKFTKNPGTAIWASFFDHAEIIDPYTVKAVLKQPEMAFLVHTVSVGRVLPKKYIEKVGDDYALQNPVGSGPWKIKKYLPGDRMEFEAFEKHYSRLPRAKTLNLLVIPDASTRMAMLQSGDADLMTGLPIDQIDAIKAKPGFQVIAKPKVTSQEGRFVTTGAGKAWLDERVRKAFMYSFNREKMSQTYYKGYSVPNPNTLLPITFGFNPDLKPWPFDPAKAKQLMAEAGYPNGLDIALLVPSAPDAEAISAILAEAGLFRAKVNVMEIGTWIAKIGSRSLPDDPPAIWWANGPSGFEFNGDAGYLAVTQHHSKAIYNYSVEDPKLDQMIEAQAVITDVEKRKKTLQDLFAYMYEHQYFPAGFWHSFIVVAGPKIKSWSPVNGWTLMYDTAEPKS